LEGPCVGGASICQGFVLCHREGLIEVPLAVTMSLIVMARRYILHWLIFLTCNGLNCFYAANVSLILASLVLLGVGQGWVSLRNMMMWSCMISQQRRIHPFSHELYAFGEWKMGLVRPDCICSEPMVARRVFDMVPFSRMCPQSIRRRRRSLVAVMDGRPTPR
jgi:hypothetical protein